MAVPYLRPEAPEPPLLHPVPAEQRTRLWRFASLIAVTLTLTATLAGCAGDAGSGALPVPTEPPTDATVTPTDPMDPSGPRPLEGFALLRVEPDQAQLGEPTDVILFGNDFAAGMTVLFGATPASDLLVLSSTTAVCLAPPHAPGVVDVTAVLPTAVGSELRVLEAAFSYVSDLHVGSVDPSAGSVDGGELLTIHGAGFTPQTLAFIGGRPAIETRYVGPSTLSAVAPPGRFGPATVHVSDRSGVTVAVDGYHYSAAPKVDVITPLFGPADGGTIVEMTGTGLTAEAGVLFGDQPAEVRWATLDGTRMEVRVPPGEAGSVVDVEVSTLYGTERVSRGWLWEGGGGETACPTLQPSNGVLTGGEIVTIVCTGLSGDVQVRFGGSTAPVLGRADHANRLDVQVPPGEAGPAEVIVSTEDGSVVVGTLFTYERQASRTILAVEPRVGDVAGGQRLEIHGEGLPADAEVFIGALRATAVEAQGSGLLVVTTPKGQPGTVDVRVVAATDTTGATTRLERAFTYWRDTVALDIVTPTFVGRPGGALVKARGSGFANGARLRVGERWCEDLEVISPSLLECRSPALEPGTYDVTLESGTATRTLRRAITAYDPVSPAAGTWGDPIRGQLNVTVLTSYYHEALWQPLPGADVVVRAPGHRELRGLTDGVGQITFSEDVFGGPVEVTAAYSGLEAATVVRYDATNLTLILTQVQPPSPPSSGGGVAPPAGFEPALLSGEVRGLGKYVLPPPSSCDEAPATGREDCSRCDLELGCSDPDYMCADLQTGDQGSGRCVRTCTQPADCSDGYTCGIVGAGLGCVPSPGRKVARCFPSIRNELRTEADIERLVEVSANNPHYLLEPERLGDMAIVCVGGWVSTAGTFTPTTLGVRRNVFAEPGGRHTDLDIELRYPLDRDLRVRTLGAPHSPDGLADPEITLNLVLGSDGVVPMSRPLVADGYDRWIIPHQLGELSGDLRGATFVMFGAIRGPGLDAPGRPRLGAFSMAYGTTALLTERLPVWDGEGWRYDQARLPYDLNDVWAAPAGRLMVAVGDGGRILHFNGLSWTSQTSPTSRTLRSVAGLVGGSVWAVGDRGAVVHWDGLSWQKVAGPSDADLVAVAAVYGGSVFVAGGDGVYRRSSDGSWATAAIGDGTRVHALHAGDDGVVVAVGAQGLLARRAPGQAWELLDSGTKASLNAVWRDAKRGEIVAAGDLGTLLTWRHGAAQHQPAAGPFALTSITHFAPTLGQDDGAAELLVVGDGGQAMRRTGGVWVAAPLEGYHSRANGVAAAPDGSARVVGSAGFDLGPFLELATIDPPQVLSGAELAFSWGWSGGADGDYTRATLSERYFEMARQVWDVLVEPRERDVRLPAVGISALGEGEWELDVLRVLNIDFDLDNHTNHDLELLRRVSWSRSRLIIP